MGEDFVAGSCCGKNHRASSVLTPTLQRTTDGQPLPWLVEKDQRPGSPAFCTKRLFSVTPLSTIRELSRVATQILTPNGPLLWITHFSSRWSTSEFPVSRDLVQQTIVARRLMRRLRSQRRMRKPSEHTQAVINCHNDHPLGHQGGTVVFSATHDATAAVNPKHDRLRVLVVQAGSHYIQIQTILLVLPTGFTSDGSPPTAVTVL